MKTRSAITDLERLTAAIAAAETQIVRCVSSSLRARSISTEAYAIRFELTRRNASEQVVMYSPRRLLKASSRLVQMEQPIAPPSGASAGVIVMNVRLLQCVSI